MQAIELIIFWSVEIVDEQTQAVYDVSPKSANPGMQKPEEKGLKKSGLGLRAEEVWAKEVGLGAEELVLFYSHPYPLVSSLIPSFAPKSFAQYLQPPALSPQPNVFSPNSQVP